MRNPEPWARDEDEARVRKQIPKAVKALRDRRDRYGDIPLDAFERARLPTLEHLVDHA